MANAVVTCNTKEEMVREVAARLTLLDQEPDRLTVAEAFVSQLEPRAGIYTLNEKLDKVAHHTYRASGSSAGANDEESYHGFSVNTLTPWKPIFSIIRVVAANGAVSYRILPN